MDSPLNFITVLTTLGFSNVARRNEIIQQGIDTGEELRDLSKEELDQVFQENRSNNRRRTNAGQIVLSIPSKSKLECLRYEFKLRESCGSPMDAAALLAFSADDARELVVQKQLHAEAKLNADTLPTVDVPKLEKENWRSFRDAFQEFLSRQVGANGIPLSYVIREDENSADYDVDYPTLTDKLVACTTLDGVKYVLDRKNVFSFLSTYLKDSQAEITVKRFNRSRNGRDCWMALKVHFESVSYKSKMKATAIANIRASEYTGPKKNFTLSSLYLIHTNAHNMLEEAELPYSESQKIQEFQSCLKEATAIEKSVSTITSLGAVHTFEEYYNSMNGQLSAIIALSLAATTSKLSNRNINEMTTDRHGRGRGGRGRGRGRGRGAGRGDRTGRHFGGRGRGRGRGRGGYNRHNPYDSTNSNKSWQPRLGAIPDDEWYGYTDIQRSRVYDLRNAAENHDNNRSVNQVSFRDDQSIPSQIQGGNNNATLPPPPGDREVQQPAQSGTSVGTSRGSVGSAFGTRNNNRNGRGY